MLIVFHSGQTGVERGAHRGAVVAGLPVAGFMPSDERDELGPIPPEIATRLTSWTERGPRPAVRANVMAATASILVVPDRTKVSKYTAMNAVLAAIRTAKTRYLAVDPTVDLDDVADWARELPVTSGSARVHVTGPRETRWAEGESFAMRLVVNLT